MARRAAIPALHPTLCSARCRRPRRSQTRQELGRETNNVAEYFALLAALDYAAAHQVRALRIRSDSELLVRQMQGRYKVKSPDLSPLYERAMKISR